MQKLDPKVVWIFFASMAARLFVPLAFFSVYIQPGRFIDFTTKYEGSEISDSVAKEMIGGFILNAVGWFFVWFLVLLILVYIWARLSYRFYSYELREDGFRKEFGVIWKKYVTIPYDRIQNIDIYRGVLARLLGLSDLEVQTAGASATVSRYRMSGLGAEGRLPGLSQEIAEKLRDELVQRARTSKNQGL